MTTQQQVLDLLKTVVDPELGINVVDLGLIYDVVIEDDRVHIVMTLTTPGCPLHESMTQAVRNAVQIAHLTKQVFVELVWEPRWTPDRLSADARRMLGWGVS